MPYFIYSFSEKNLMILCDLQKKLVSESNKGSNLFDEIKKLLADRLKQK